MSAISDSLSQTSIFGVPAEQRADFDTRAAFEAAWKQHKATCPNTSVESFRAGFLAGLYHSSNLFSGALGGSR